MPVLQAFQTKWTPIGVDFGARGVRCVQARTGSGPSARHIVVSTAQQERPASAAAGAPRAAAAPAPADDSVELVENCLRRGGFRGRRAVAALGTPDLEIHALELPTAVLRGDAEQVVRIEVERLMTDPPAAFETRHWVLPESSASATNALGVAVSHEHIERLLSACSAAGLVCSCVDAGAAALARFASRLRPWPGNVVWGILDLGDRASRLVVCVDDCPVLVRIAGTGGRIWTERIAASLQVSFKAAEVHKRHHGIRLRRDRQSPEPPDRVAAIPRIESDGTRSELASMILGALRMDLTDLAAEIKRSYEYVLSCYPKRRAADLLLVGGGAALPNLPEHLAQSLGIPVKRASEYLNEPECGIVFPQTGAVPMEGYALAIGLTVRE